MGLVPGDAVQVQVVHLLAGPRQAAALCDQFARHVPLLLADGLEDMVVKDAEGAKLGRGARHRIAHDGMQRDRCIVGARDGVHFQKGKAALGGALGAVGHDQRGAIKIRQGLDALGQHHRIAIDAVAKPARAAESAGDHVAGSDPHADLHQRRRIALGVQRRQTFGHPGRHDRHAVGGFAGMQRMIGVIQRRVPEGGKAVCGQPVNGAAMGQRLVNQRRQYPLHHAGEAGRIALEGVGQALLVAHAAHQVRDGTDFAVNVQQFGLARDLLDGGARQRIRKGHAQSGIRAAHVVEPGGGACAKGEQQEKPRGCRIGLHAMADIQKPGSQTQRGQRHDHKGRRPARPEAQQQDHAGTQHQQRQRLGQQHAVRPRQHIAAAQVFQTLRGHAGDAGRPEGRGGQRAFGADNHDSILRRVLRPVQQAHRRICRVMQPHRTIAAGRYGATRFQRCNAHAPEKGQRIAFVAEDGDRAFARRHPQAFRRQSRYQALAEAERDGGAAHHAVAVRHQVGRRDAGGIVFQKGGGCRGAVKARHLSKRIAGAAIDKAGLQVRRAPRRAQHHRHHALDVLQRRRQVVPWFGQLCQLGLGGLAAGRQPRRQALRRSPRRDRRGKDHQPGPGKAQAARRLNQAVLVQAGQLQHPNPVGPCHPWGVTLEGIEQAAGQRPLQPPGIAEDGQHAQRHQQCRSQPHADGPGPVHESKHASPDFPAP